MQRLVPITPLAPPTAQPKGPPEGAGPPPAAAPFFATVTFLEGGASPPSGPVDPGYGIELPVDPGYGHPLLPPHVGGRPPGLGFPHPSHPIYHPDKPTPPGEVEPPEPPTIWPPLQPGKPEGPGKPPVETIPPGYIYVIIPGYGGRWVHVGEKPEGPDKPKPPGGAEPKR